MKPVNPAVSLPAPELVSIDDLHLSIVSLAARINAETYDWCDAELNDTDSKVRRFSISAN